MICVLYGRERFPLPRFGTSIPMNEQGTKVHRTRRIAAYRSLCLQYNVHNMSRNKGGYFGNRFGTKCFCNLIFTIMFTKYIS